MARLFGTDGVRGIANSELTPELAMDIGRAVAFLLAKDSGKRAKILIGKDTRVSSDMLENALAAGLCSAGADVVLLGFIPTPAVAYLVREYQADAGVVISASHNTMEYNGIKIFNSGGFKLADEIEDEIEAHIKTGDAVRKTGGEVGSVSFSGAASDDYVDYLESCIDGDLSGVHVVIDCANGASYETARKLFRRLKADADFIAVAPDGRNINAGVGSTHLDALKQRVVETGADIGIAFDGDADRCLAVDETGEEIDGDQIIGVIAKQMKKENRLKKDTAVVTVYSNMGFVDFCSGYGIKTVRTATGDRYVLEEMLREGYSVGGEQSGHVILLDHSTTGDGELTAAKFLSILKNSEKRASELAGEVKKYPQVLKNVKADKEQKTKFQNDQEIASFLKQQESILGNSGRILVRVSGTEPLIRIMVECSDPVLMNSVADAIEQKLLERI